MRPTWHEYFMMMAKFAALRSTCNSRPTGAVIVKNNKIISTGYNGSLPGNKQCSDQSEKYCYRRTIEKGTNSYGVCKSIHAEENAILQAARMGIKIEDSVMYCTLSPCLICAKSIKGAGINKVYYEHLYESEDLERDKQWTDFINQELNAEQIVLDRKTRELFAHNAITITSMRRLI